MKKFIKSISFRRIIFLSTILLIVNSFLSLKVFANTEVPNTYSPACILIDADSGKILYEKNSKEQMYPASTTKIMTAILTLENCNLTDIAIVSKNAVESIPYSYSTASLREGEELTIEQLLNVLLIPSANDAAVVLAEHIAGSVENFSNMMNTKAEELGCLNTHFVNPNGIHDKNHYSTAYDLALIGKYSMQFDTFRSIVAKTFYSLASTNIYDKNDRLFVTTNELIRENYSSYASNYYYKYATGAKTGYTDPAQSCIVATAQKDGVSLIAVILHGESTEAGLSQRYIDCKTLFEYGFNNFSTKKIITKGQIAEQVHILGATQETADLNLLYLNDVSVLVPNDYDISLLTPNIEVTDGLFAPISEGTKLGSVTYTIDGIDYSCDLVASHIVYRSEISKTIMQIGILIILLFLFYKFIKFKNRKKRKRNYRITKK